MKKKLATILSGCSPWVLIILALVWSALELWNRIDTAAYAYPERLITYNLKNAKTGDEMVALVKEWHSLHWGAQIASLQVLCERNREFVNRLAGADAATQICRVVQ